MAKKLKLADVEHYAYIEIKKRKRIITRIYFGFIFAAITFVLFQQLYQGFHWMTSVVPVCVVGSFSLLAPVTEKWVYKPWQKTAQRLEATKVEYLYKY